LAINSILDDLRMIDKVPSNAIVCDPNRQGKNIPKGDIS